MASTIDVDLAILGGGAAGLGAVREGRRRGASVALVTDGPPGGDCTFTGCVPSKTLIESATAGHDFDAAMARVRAVVDRIAATESAEALRAAGVEVITGVGRLTDRSRILVDGRTIRARRIVLALGSRPRMLPVPGLDGVGPLTTDSLWDLDRAPASLIVMGGGAIGCELGQALARLGVAVTIVELADRLLAGEEPAVSAIVAKALEADGVTVRTGTSIERVRSVAGGVEAELAAGEVVAAERILVAVGREPAAEGAGLAEVGVEVDDRGYVRTDDRLATNLRGVFAAGDIVGRAQLSHAADHMGMLAAANGLGRVAWQRYRADRIPAVTFTAPEAGRIGLTESEAADQVDGAMVAELPLSDHDRALAADATDGYLKLIAGPRPVIGSVAGGRLIGATVVADRAGEMIAELAVAMKLPFLGQLAVTVHPYPTWSYGIAKAAGQFFTEVDGRSARPARSSV